MKQNCDGLTQSRLKSLLDYDPETGWFTWRARRGSKAKGSCAGHILKGGYIQVRVDRKLYLAHRLAFLWMSGELPGDYVDHINCDPSDNRWVNLRTATPTQNQCNALNQSNNTSGFKGVSWNKKLEKWRAQIRTHGTNKHIGYFPTRIEAAKAYDEACIKRHGEFAKTNAMMGLL